jgi:hypothetical protein
MYSTDTTNENVFKHPLGIIALLNDPNYTSWKADCKQVLHGIKAWRIVMGEEGQPENHEGMTKAAFMDVGSIRISLRRKPRPAPSSTDHATPKLKSISTRLRTP